jgi:hypothetical protein
VWRAFIVIAALATSAVVFGVVPARAANVTFAEAKVASIDGKCLDWGGGEFSKSGQEVTLRKCEGDRRQGFTIQPDNTLLARASFATPKPVPLCLALTVPQVGGRAKLDFCDGRPGMWNTQLWNVAGVNGPIVNVSTGLCLMPAGGSSADGTAVVANACTNTPDQKWTAWANERFLEVPPSQVSYAGESARTFHTSVGGEGNGPRLAPYVWSAQGLPPGTSIQSRAGQALTLETHIFGTPTTPGFYHVTARATDRDGAVLEENFTWTVKEPRIVVPNLFGLGSDEASLVVRNAGLTPNPGGTVPRDDPQLNGKVVQQTPVAGTRAERGTVVRYSFGRFVPDQCGPFPC